MSDRLEIERLIKDLGLFNNGPEEHKDASPPSVCRLHWNPFDLLYPLCPIHTLWCTWTKWISSDEKPQTFRKSSHKSIKGIITSFKWSLKLSVYDTLTYAMHSKDLCCKVVIYSTPICAISTLLLLLSYVSRHAFWQSQQSMPKNVVLKEYMHTFPSICRPAALYTYWTRAPLNLFSQ